MAQDPNAQTGSNDKLDQDGDVPTKPQSEQDEYLLDMVFVLDCTGSMASYINSARDNIVKISQELSKLSQKPSNPPENQSNDPPPDPSNNPSNPSQDPDTTAQIEGQIDTALAPAAPADSADTTSPTDSNDVSKDPKNPKDEKNPSDITEAADDSKSPESTKVINPEPKKKLSCKFAVVAYRDHQDDFITQVRSFTGSSVMIKQYLSTLTANGGGDGPEALTTALYDVLYNLNYRNNSQKIVIVITDAPPHGIESDAVSDNHRNGDPWPKWKLSKILDLTGNKMNKINKLNKNKYLSVKSRCKESGESTDTPDDGNMEDILSITRKITDDLQASFYTVACEPCLSTNYDYGRDLMEAMAEMSNGKYLPLASANLLPKVIIGSVKQQMLIDELTADIDKEIEELKIQYKDEGKEDELTEDIIAEFMEKKWENANLTYKEVAIGTLYRKERGRDNIELLLNRQECKNLKDFQEKRVKLERLQRSDFRHLSSSTGYPGYPESVRRPSRDLDMDEFALHRFDTPLSRRISGDSSLRRTKTMMVSSGVRASRPRRSSAMIQEVDYDRRESSGLFSGVINGIGSLFSGLGDVMNVSDNNNNKKKKRSNINTSTKSDISTDAIRSSSMTISNDEKEIESGTDSTDATGDIKDKKKRARRRRKNKIKTNESMTLSMRWGDDNDDNRSCSEDEQEVYEQVRSMDKKGVKKAVSRYMQTYY